MKRVAKIFKELYVSPGGLLIGIIAVEAVVLAIFGGLGHMTLSFFV